MFYPEPLGTVAHESLRRGKDLSRGFAERVEKAGLSPYVETVFMRDLVSQRAQFAPFIGIRVQYRVATLGCSDMELAPSGFGIRFIL